MRWIDTCASWHPWAGFKSEFLYIDLPMPRNVRTIRPTLMSVALAAEVDVSTVSRVLSGDTSQRVSEETRERILACAKQLDYQPNMTARSLRVARTFSLGIAVPQLDNPVFSQMIIGAERAARAYGYSLLIAHIEEGGGDIDAYARLASTNRVDGLLVTTLDDNSVVLKAAKQAKVPVLMLNRKVYGVRNSIRFDAAGAAHIAMNHLIGLGHRRIAHLSGQLNPSTGLGRFSGYREALLKAGLEVDPSLVAVSGYTIKGGADAMREILLRPGPRPTAVFPLTLLAATGAMMTLHEHGIRVPQDMSVVTVHDGPIAEAMFPPLTTVRMPVEQMGFDGVVGLIQLIRGERKTVDFMLAPIELVVRGSTARVDNAALNE